MNLWLLSSVVTPSLVLFLFLPSFTSTNFCLSFLTMNMHVYYSIVLFFSNKAWNFPSKCRHLHRAEFDSFSLCSCSISELVYYFFLPKISQNPTSWVASGTFHYFSQEYCIQQSIKNRRCWTKGVWNGIEAGSNQYFLCRICVLNVLECVWVYLTKLKILIYAPYFFLCQLQEMA